MTDNTTSAGVAAPPQSETGGDVSPDQPTGESLHDAILTYLAPDAETRKRARWEAWEFEVTGSHQIRVVNASWGADKADHAYTVSVAERGRLFVPAECPCPADRYHDGPCKHRVSIVIHGGPELLGEAVVYHEDTPDDPLDGETTLAEKLGYE